MRRSKLITYLFGLAALGAGLWFLMRTGSDRATGADSEPSAQAVPPHPMDASVQAAPVEKMSGIAAPPASAQEVAQSSPRAGNPLVFPPVEKLSDEARANPHATPESLIQFSHALGLRLEGAKRSPEDAASLFSELERNCLAPESGEGKRVAVTIQVLCYSTAEELSKVYPDRFKARFDRAADQLSPEARRLRGAMQALSVDASSGS